MADDGNNRRLFDHFIVAGLSENPEELTPLEHECGNKAHEALAPITDITIIFPGQGEQVPPGFTCIETTPSGYPADLNHGSIRTHSAFLCYRRGYQKPPLVDIGIMDEGKKERPMEDSTVVQYTPDGRPANVSNTSSALYFTYRRCKTNGPPHQLVITHISVIIASKGEVPPHTFYKIDKNLNKAMVGSDVYVCYKKAQSCCRRIAYKPAVLDRFPKTDDEVNSFAQNVPMFCLPMGAVIESWSVECGPPEELFSTCVLTDADGTKYYGASLTFYEKYTQELNQHQKDVLSFDMESKNQEENPDSPKEVSPNQLFFMNKSICVVSRYPFFECFRRFLYYVYYMSVYPDSQRVPIERYVSHLMYEVPFPTTSKPRVLVQLGEDLVAFENHDDSQVPLSGAQFHEVLRNMNVDNFIYAMSLALLEQKILIHSLRPWLLTVVSETICALMFPFHWQCPYVPQCPLALAGVLHAPLPFIAGVDSRYFDLYEDPPGDVTCFDLDTATVRYSVNKKLIKDAALPKKPFKRLKQALENILDKIRSDDREREKIRKMKVEGSNSGDMDHQIQIRKASYELLIREAFLRFMCSIMDGYTNFLKPITECPRTAHATDMSERFDLEGFLRSRDKSTIDFYKKFSETQSFIRFIEERSFISDKVAYNAFFDECIQRCAAKSDPYLELLDRDLYSVNHTIVIPPPELLNPKSAELVYKLAKNKLKVLRLAMTILRRVSKAAIPLLDQVSYRLLMELCGEYGYPDVAVDVLHEMRRLSIVPNAITYAVYHWAVMEGKWPGEARLKAIWAWKRIKIRLDVCSRFSAIRRDPSGVIPNNVRELPHDLNTTMDDTTTSMENTSNISVEDVAVNPSMSSTPDIDGHSASSRDLKEEDEREKALREQPYIMTIDPLPDKNDNKSEDEKEELTSDPLTASVHSEEERKAKSASLNISPSREQFLREHSASPFAKDLASLDDRLMSKRKSSSKGPSSWFKKLTSSPVVSNLMRSHTAEDIKHSDEDSRSTGNNELSVSSITMSPSFSSLVNSVRKHALKGYDAVSQQGNVLLKKSGVNSLVNEMKNLNKSYLKDSSFTSSANEESFLNGTVNYQDHLNASDPAFQLDSGSSGDFLSMDFWMRDLLMEIADDDEDSYIIDATLCSSSTCPRCSHIIYDEDLAAGWTVDDSNLNTACPYCYFSFAPSLKVNLEQRVESIQQSWYTPFQSKSYRATENTDVKVAPETLSVPFKLIDGLNADGSLNDVKASKIVAGKDPEFANLLLQSLAIEAASSMPSKHRSKSKDKGDKDKEKKKKSKSSDESKSKKSRKSSTTEKEKKEKKEKKSKSKSKEKKSDEIVDPVDRNEVNPDTSYVERESSGGTSKGGDDSGIAEETGAESERHDFENHSRESSGTRQSRINNTESFNGYTPMDTILEPEKIDDGEIVKRPTTGAIRPQTALGRPGTASARPAPPKVKKTKVADLDTTIVSQQSSGFDKSLVLMEDYDNLKKENDSDDFIVEEEDEIVVNQKTGIGADISELTQGSEHGQLVNRIIENTRKLEDDGNAFIDSGSFYDISEQKKMRAEVEAVQRALQATAQSTNPLSRSLDFIVEDFDLMLKEIEDNRKLAEDSTRLSVDVDRSLVASERRQNLWKMATDQLIAGNLFKIMQEIVQSHRDINPVTKTMALRNHFSLYRDILFVAIDHFKHNVDREQFDRMYNADFRKFSVQISQLLDAPDKPPKPISIACRRIFLPLDIF
ncbi:hypothetical protein FO519_005989 [Halicephalobus sp. NKZ332]|nr:hypothetical protein FO519_005989 [Halicephalobus sp. NKZ332]